MDVCRRHRVLPFQGRDFGTVYRQLSADVTPALHRCGGVLVASLGNRIRYCSSSTSGHTETDRYLSAFGAAVGYTPTMDADVLAAHELARERFLAAKH
jgi:hypothetical protein